MTDNLDRKRSRSGEDNLVEMSDAAAQDEPSKESKMKKMKAKYPSGPLFTLKKWNAVAMWSWDVECDTCAICRVQVMGECQQVLETASPVYETICFSLRRLSALPE